MKKLASLLIASVFVSGLLIGCKGDEGDVTGAGDSGTASSAQEKTGAMDTGAGQVDAKTDAGTTAPPAGTPDAPKPGTVDAPKTDTGAAAGDGKPADGAPTGATDPKNPGPAVTPSGADGSGPVSPGN